MKFQTKRSPIIKILAWKEVKINLEKVRMVALMVVQEKVLANKPKKESQNWTKI